MTGAPPIALFLYVAALARAWDSCARPARLGYNHRHELAGRETRVQPRRAKVGTSQASRRLRGLPRTPCGSRAKRLRTIESA